MISQSTRFVICYNGEVYNTEELKKELLQNNIKTKGHSDTELILELCEIYGIKKSNSKTNWNVCIRTIRSKAKETFLCRDRLGIKPIYWSVLKNKDFIFSSELKPLKLHPNFCKTINRNIISNYLRHGYIPAPYSIYENVFKLQPRRFLEISKDDFSPKINYFWNLEEIVKKREIKENVPEDLYISQLDNLLNDSISKRMIADVPVGSFLSGGIDSTTVSSIMQKNSIKKIKTFSIGFEESDTMKLIMLSRLPII